MKRLLLSVLALCLIVSQAEWLTGQENEPAKESRPSYQPKRVVPPPKKRPDDRALPVTEQLKKLLVKQTTSRDQYLMSSAFSTLSNSPEIVKSLGSSLEPVVISGLKSESSSVVTNALSILDQSSISEDKKTEILISASESRNSAVLGRLAKTPEEVLRRITQQMLDQPEKRHPSAYAIMEHLGPQADGAVDALLANYQKILGQTENRSRQPRLDYLDMVYAIGAVGSKASKAKQIAIDAANGRFVQTQKRQEYMLAGMFCLEKLTEPAKTRKQSNAQGGLAGGGLMGGGGGAAYLQVMMRNKPLRTKVKNYIRLDRKQKENKLDNSYRRHVQLVFQNYDTQAPDKQLTLDEIRDMKANFLLEDVDNNDDGMLTEDEYFEYLRTTRPSISSLNNSNLSSVSRNTRGR